MRILCLALLSFVVLICGCSSEPTVPPPPEEEPKGTPVELLEKEHLQKVPELVRLSASWGGKGDGLRRKDLHDKALYCYHKSEETYPTEFPEDYKGATIPVMAYLRKSFVYSYMGKLELAKYYLDRVGERSELPGWAQGMADAAELQYFYVKGDYQQVLDRIPEDTKGSYRLVLKSASEYKLGDKKAHARLREAWIDFKSQAGGQYNLAPPEIRDLVNSKP